MLARWSAPPDPTSLAARVASRRGTFRLVLMRRLFFVDSVANSSAGDVDMIYMHAKHRVAEGTYVCDEADIFVEPNVAQ